MTDEAEKLSRTEDQEARVAYLPLSIRWRLPLVRANLFWEKLWPRLWPVGASLLLFFALLLSGLLPKLGAWLHSLLLLIWLIAFGLALRHLLRSDLSVGLRRSLHRLEEKSGFSGRPLTGLIDQQGSNLLDRSSRALWIDHQKKLLAKVERLRCGWPHASWAGVDRFALRTPLTLAFLLALPLGLGELPERLKSGLLPNFSPSKIVGPPRLEAWVSPPAYSGLAPFALTADPTEEGKQAAKLQILTGSELLMQVHNLDAEAYWHLGAQSGQLQPAGGFRHQISLELNESGTLYVTEGRDPEENRLASLPLEILPDQVPKVEFLTPPSQSARGAMSFEYLAEDDFAITQLRLIINPSDGLSLATGDPIRIELPVPLRDASNVEGHAFKDLSEHPWAGTPVVIHLEAHDEKGQIGQSEPFEGLLPERFFNHPVARALVEERKRLSVDPGQRLVAVKNIRKLAANPYHFREDLVVYLSLISAQARLRHSRDSKSIAEVQELLWKTALHIEEGELALAERELRALQEELQEALRSGASDETLAELMNRLQQAMDNYLDKLGEQMAKEQFQSQAPDQPLAQPDQMVGRSQLQELLDQAREMAMSGARDQAEKMLEELRNILENLQPSSPQSQQQNQFAQQMQELMREMEDILRNQQQMLDQSYQRRSEQRQQMQQGEQRPTTPGSGEGSSESMTMDSEAMQSAEEQENLRGRLSRAKRDMRRQFGQAPRSLEGAEEAMGEARDALERGEFGQSARSQAEAVEQLQQGMQVMLDSLMQQMGEGRGNEGSQSGQRNRGQSEQDPFGRSVGGTPDGGERVQLEGEDNTLERARQILEELRQRRNDLTRPQRELDYIDRLLRQF